jgi:predicted permease
MDPTSLPRMAAISIDAAVLGFTLATSAVTAIVFGIVPAIRAARQDLNRTLRASRSLSPTVLQVRLRNALVMGEVALALVLLIGAGLMMRSFVRLQQVKPGFDFERTLTFRVALPRAARPTPEARRAFVDDMERRLRAISGVTSVGFTSQLPLTGSGSLQPYAYDESTARNWESATADRRIVSPDYFRAMGTRVLSGRVFDSHATSGRTLVVIDDTLAARAWPGQSAVGQRLQVGPTGSEGDLYAEVIGVVEHMRVLDLTQAVRPEIWAPMLGVAGTFYTVVRTDRDPASLVSPVRDLMAELDPQAAVDRVLPMSSYVADGLSQARLSLALMTAFGAAALVLAVVGVYGVISYSVGQRTREIGIRMALGARPGRVRNAILLQGLRLVVPSLCLGGAGAWLLSHFISGLLYETDAADPVTFAVTIVLLLLVALMGCYLPARRATAVSPLVALRQF